VARLCLVPVAVLLVLMSPAACSSDTRPATDGPREVTAKRATIGAEPVPYNSVELEDDGRTLRVFFAGGADGCGELDRVRTEFVGADTLRVTIYLGTSGEVVEKRLDCPSVGVPSVTTVRLPRSAAGRAIVDGAKGP
jgi:hypothetical protein